ncbi:unnamed protein product [Lampetra fluviatilis]
MRTFQPTGRRLMSTCPNIKLPAFHGKGARRRGYTAPKYQLAHLALATGLSPAGGPPVPAADAVQGSGPVAHTRSRGTRLR